MGSSIGGFSVNKTPGQSKEALTLSLQLGYTKSDVNRLYKAFKKMDKFDTGVISLRSYCAVNKITTAFGELLFRRLLRLHNDVERDLNFKEYLLSSWNALSISDDDNISSTTFQIFDIDNTGSMTVEGVRHIIELIYRESDQKNMSILNVLLNNIGKRESVSQEDFVVLVRSIPSLLYPVFDLIKAVRQNTLGEKRWIEIAKLRMVPLANKMAYHNKINSPAKLNNRGRRTSAQQRDGSFSSVSSAGRNSIIQLSFTDEEKSSGSFNQEGNLSQNSSVQKSHGRRNSSLNSLDVTESPSEMRPHSFSSPGTEQGSMGVPEGWHSSSTNAMVLNAASNIKKGGFNNSTMHRVFYEGSPKMPENAHFTVKARSSSLVGAVDTSVLPKTNLDAIKVANALHFERMMKTNSQNLNKLIEANSTLVEYRKSVHLQDAAVSTSSGSSKGSEKETQDKNKAKSGKN